MFGMFNKKQKSDLEKQIDKDGIDYAVKRFSEIIIGKLQSTDVAYQFILEEIEAASQGNDAAINFARESGITPDEYKGSIENSSPEVDGAGGPQQTLLTICSQLMSNPDLMVELRTKITDNIMRNFSFGIYKSQQTYLDGGMRLEEAEVDIMFIAKNNKLIYTNDEADHLFSLDKDGDKKLDGRVVNMVFTGQSDNSVVEVFVVFDDSESYTMFTLGAGRDERFNYVAQAIFKYFMNNKIEGVFSLTQQYASQYIYTFKLYQKSSRYFMINNSHSQTYLINGDSIKVTVN